MPSEKPHNPQRPSPLPPQEKIAALLQAHPKIVDLSLQRIAVLLQALGNPHLRLPPIIHIAGTNGKGSASAFARAFLECAGYSVHVYTSPHLVHWRERYRLGAKNADGAVNSAFVQDAILAAALEEVSKANAGRPITIFEILTAAAFVLFARFPADALVLETGLGGRFDATNAILKPAVSLIMPIALDHQAFLGEKIAQIAAEKAGIIKPHCPVVSACQPYAAAKAVLQRAARESQAPLSLFGRDYHARADGQAWLFQNAQTALRLPLPQLYGAFQIDNAAAALEAVLTAGFTIPEQAAQAAMQAVYWPARMQRLTAGAVWRQAPQGSEIWLDGGHNPAAAQMLAQALRPLIQNRPFYMLGALLQTKDAARYLRCFTPLAPCFYAVPMENSGQAVPPAALAAIARQAGLKAQPAASVAAALADIAARTAKADAAAKAAGKSSRPPSILICGSLYLAGAVLAQNGTPPQ